MAPDNRITAYFITLWLNCKYYVDLFRYFWPILNKIKFALSPVQVVIERSGPVFGKARRRHFPGRWHYFFRLLYPFPFLIRSRLEKRLKAVNYAFVCHCDCLHFHRRFDPFFAFRIGFTQRESIDVHQITGFITYQKKKDTMHANTLLQRQRLCRKMKGSENKNVHKRLLFQFFYCLFLKSYNSQFFKLIIHRKFYHLQGSLVKFGH